VLIRGTDDTDRPTVLDVVRAAFGGEEEVELVQQIWAMPAHLPDLDLIAVERGDVVGHVLCSRAHVGDREVVALAPLCARPDRQRAGVGRALLTEVIGRADAAREPLIGLLGHPSYYPRFGFERARSIGIDTPWPMDDDTPFMVKRLAAYEPTLQGRFRYAWQEEQS
jgi:putative acetyltransferase